VSESSDARSDEQSDGVDGVDSLCVAYRHDVHKLFGRSHGSGVDELLACR